MGKDPGAVVLAEGSAWVVNTHDDTVSRVDPATGKSVTISVVSLIPGSTPEAIQQFNIGEGRYPKDLDELAQKQYIPKIPTPPYGYKIDYNAADGSVKVVPQ